MFTKSSWLHLRIPFSYFLLPIFLFTLVLSPNLNSSLLLWTFLIIHLFLYPASNGYNSYFDKDEKSIGGLENPPPVNRGLYYLALTFDLIAIILGAILVNPEFTLMLIVYGLVSKAYSHPWIRLKKYAIFSWIITGVFQGFFTVIMIYIGINQFSFSNVAKEPLLWGGVLTSIMLWANYPMTQIYQHEEDSKRGDRTISILLGIKGTFYFVGILFTVVTLGFFFYFKTFFAVEYGYWFVAVLAPVVLYFIWWFAKVLRNEAAADYRHTMWLNFLSATCLNIFFIYLFLDYTNISQAFQ
jgi:4-hydroxybenzoate polyprenyltransferase